MSLFQQLLNILHSSRSIQIINLYSLLIGVLYHDMFEFNCSYKNKINAIISFKTCVCFLFSFSWKRWGGGWRLSQRLKQMEYATTQKYDHFIIYAKLSPPVKTVWFGHNMYKPHVCLLLFYRISFGTNENEFGNEYCTS